MHLPGHLSTLWVDVLQCACESSGPYQPGNLLLDQVIYIHLPDSTFDEGGHDGDAEAAAADDEDLDELAASLEVLRHHQRGAVPR